MTSLHRRPHRLSRAAIREEPTRTGLPKGELTKACMFFGTCWRRDSDLNLDQSLFGVAAIERSKSRRLRAPRNHLGLLRKSAAFSAGLCRVRGVAKRENSTEFALDLDARRAVLRHEPDCVNERADGVEGFGARGGMVEGFVKRGDPLPVDLGEVRVEQRLRQRPGGKLLLECRLSHLRRPQLLL